MQNKLYDYLGESLSFFKNLVVFFEITNLAVCVFSHIATWTKLFLKEMSYKVSMHEL